MLVSNQKQWDDYLIDYGTGHFDKTFLICDATEGINQMELYFLRHLMHNHRLVSFVITTISNLTGFHNLFGIGDVFYSEVSHW